MKHLKRFKYKLKNKKCTVQKRLYFISTLIKLNKDSLKKRREMQKSLKTKYKKLDETDKTFFYSLMKTLLIHKKLIKSLKRKLNRGK